ncbi:MAG TPA: hypothetical protein VHR97_14690 [Candidatus Baltobacteraceae bacterium]|jgi:hypothetical protein|nr:hypothetical protein [Candidatus Baltobacteraceae bacterium]
MTATYIFAVTAALAGDIVAVLLIWSLGYHEAKRRFNERQRTSFAAINMALTELDTAELKLVQASPGDKVVALLRRATAKRNKVSGDVAARQSEFRTS